MRTHVLMGYTYGTHRQKNVVEETRWLPARAEALGAIASSCFGAGFGGSVWALVDVKNADSFAAQWQRDYCFAFADAGSRATFFSMRPGPGAHQVIPI